MAPSHYHARDLWYYQRGVEATPYKWYYQHGMEAVHHSLANGDKIIQNPSPLLLQCRCDSHFNKQKDFHLHSAPQNLFFRYITPPLNAISATLFVGSTYKNKCPYCLFYLQQVLASRLSLTSAGQSFPCLHCFRIFGAL